MSTRIERDRYSPGGNYPFADVPREEWVHDPAIELLPEDRQRFWQQRTPDGLVRLCNVSQTLIQQEVFGYVMGRVVVALDRLERKL